MATGRPSCGIVGQVHFRHPARAELRANLVAPEPQARSDRDHWSESTSVRRLCPRIFERHGAVEDRRAGLQSGSTAK